MKPSDIIKQFSDGPIAFHRVYVTLTGSVTAGLMLSQAMYWTVRGSDGWFYKTQQDWERETGMTRREQDSARTRLKQLGFWQEELKGVPAKLHYRIDLDKLTSSLYENAKLDCTNPPNKNGGNEQTTLYNTKTTTETISNTESSFEDSSINHTVESDSPTQEEGSTEPQKSARGRKSKKDADPPEPALIPCRELWIANLGEAGWKYGRDDKAMKECLKTVRTLLEEAGATIITPDLVAAGFRKVFLWAKEKGHWAYNGPMTNFNTQFQFIYNEMRYGKKVATSDYQRRLNEADAIRRVPEQDF